PKTTPSDPCTKLECLHGDCRVVEDVAQCVCQAGYAGERCDACVPGYQDNDVDGTCEPGCDMPGVCAVSYGCDDSTGVVQCVALPPGSITRFTWNDVGAISLYWNPPPPAGLRFALCVRKDPLPAVPAPGLLSAAGRAA